MTTKPEKRPERQRGGFPSVAEIGEMTGKGYVSPSEAAKVVNRSRQTIYGWLRRGIIPAEVVVVGEPSGAIWIQRTFLEGMTTAAGAGG